MNQDAFAAKMAQSTGINVPGVTTGVPGAVKSTAAAAPVFQPAAAAASSVGSTTATTPIVVPKKKALSDGDQSTGFLTDTAGGAKTAMGQ